MCVHGKHRSHSESTRPSYGGCTLAFIDALPTHTTLTESLFNFYKLLKTTEERTDDDIVLIQAAIDRCCSFYRKYINKQVTPKVHYIEVHFVPIIRKYQSLWLFAEAGIESFHHWLANFSGEFVGPQIAK